MCSEDHVAVSSLSRLLVPHVRQRTVTTIFFVLFITIVRGRIIVLMVLLILIFQLLLRFCILVSIAVCTLLIRVQICETRCFRGFSCGLWLWAIVTYKASDFVVTWIDSQLGYLFVLRSHYSMRIGFLKRIIIRFRNMSIVVSIGWKTVKTDRINNRVGLLDDLVDLLNATNLFGILKSYAYARLYLRNIWI